jgi:hypothetical protein
MHNNTGRQSDRATERNQISERLLNGAIVGGAAKQILAMFAQRCSCRRERGREGGVSERERWAGGERRERVCARTRCALSAMLLFLCPCI